MGGDLKEENVDEDGYYMDEDIDYLE